MKKVISKDGTAIAFDRSGEGPPIILVVGAFNDRSTGAPLAKLLEAHFTVFTYDRRGRGESGDTAPYAVDREVEDLEALIVEAGGSASVFGYSSGATLSLKAAARGLAITKLALYEPPLIVDDRRPRPPEDLAAQLTELVSSGRRGDAVELFQTKGVGIPVEVVAQLRQCAVPAGARGHGAHPRLRNDHPGRHVGTDRTGGLHHGTHARDKRWRQPGVSAQRGASAGGRPPQCAAPPPFRSDSRHRPGGPRSRVGGVLRRLKRHRAENLVSTTIAGSARVNSGTLDDARAEACKIVQASLFFPTSMRPEKPLHLCMGSCHFALYLRCG